MFLGMARIISGLSLTEAAERLNVKVSTLISWEQYKTSPSIENACKLSNLYAVPIDVIEWGPVKRRKH